MFDEDDSDYGQCGTMWMTIYSGFTYEKTDTYYVEDPNLDESEHEYAFVSFGTVHSSFASSGQYGCAVCLEVGSEEDTTFSSGDKGLGWCWGDTASTAGDDSGFISYGTVKAVDDTKIMLEETNGWDGTVKQVFETDGTTTSAFSYRFASGVSANGHLLMYSKNLKDGGSKGDLGFSFGSDVAIKCYCSEILTS